MHRNMTINAFMAKGKPKGHGAGILPQSTDQLLRITNTVSDDAIETVAQTVLRQRARDTTIPYRDRFEMLEEAGFSRREIQAMINPHAIADFHHKLPGGRTLHHCPKKKHGMDQKRCIKDGCIIECPTCGVYISGGYGSRCRSCESREFAVQRAAQDAARAERAKQKTAEQEREMAMEVKGRKNKAKWSEHKRQFRAHAKMARIVGGRITKKLGVKDAGPGAARKALLADISDTDDDDEVDEEMDEEYRLDPEKRSRYENLIAFWLLDYGQDLLA
ncbi:hypothetical protein ACHAQH_001840 [Verticillium albo-atrum]